MCGIFCMLYQLFCIISSDILRLISHLTVLCIHLCVLYKRFIYDIRTYLTHTICRLFVSFLFILSIVNTFRKSSSRNNNLYGIFRSSINLINYCKRIKITNIIMFSYHIYVKLSVKCI